MSFRSMPGSAKSSAEDGKPARTAFGEKGNVAGWAGKGWADGQVHADQIWKSEQKENI